MKTAMKRTRSMIFLLTAVAAGYGFGALTHLIEGEAYLARAVEWEEPHRTDALLITSDPALERYFFLGTTFPDIRSLISDLGFDTHDPEFGFALVAAGDEAREATPWKLAFARGYLQHSASDISEQLFVSPSFAIESGVGEPDIFDGLLDDGPGGENQLFVEIGIDLYHGDIGLFLDLLDFFVMERHAQRLLEVVDFWYETAQAFFGEGIIAREALDAEISEYLREIRAMRPLLREPRLERILRRLRRRSLGENFRRYLPLVARYLERTGNTDIAIDFAELERLSDTPILADRAYFDRYFERFRWLGATIHLEYEKRWHVMWPVWDKTVFQSAAIESLAQLLPTHFDPSWERIVFRAAFFDAEGGERLDAISAQAPPRQLRVSVVLYDTVPGAGPVTVQVRRDLAGGYDADPLCPGATATVIDPGTDPLDYGEVPRMTIEFTFDPAPCLEGAQGLYLEVSGEGRPFYTASWEVFEEIPTRDLSQAPYQRFFAPPIERTGYLSIERSPAISGLGGRSRR